MLRVDDVIFAYPDQKAPYHFGFSAEPGQVTAISGASGSGKSTLLDLLAGFLKPMSGRIDLDGTDLVPMAPEARPASLLLQSDSLFDHLTAEKNIALGLPAGADGSTIKSAVSAALAEVGLDCFAGQIASTLSGGQKQRVALARTLLRDRPILLLDEPFSALDDETRILIRNLVRTLTERHGWHTILVSHHVDDIAALASRHYQLADLRLQTAALTQPRP